MNRTDLAALIAEEHDISKTLAGDIVQSTFKHIMDAVQRGDQVAFQGFGSFGVSERNARKGFNPLTREPVEIPASRVPKFAPGAGFKAIVDPAAAERKAAKRKVG